VTYYLHSDACGYFDGGGVRRVNTAHCTDACRPVAVLDPEDREAVERLADAHLLALGGHGKGSVVVMQAALRSLIAPPRPDEPGKWGVVEASCVHSDNRRPWVRDGGGNWWPTGPYDRSDRKPERFPDCWDDLIEPTVTRDGVS
jgi:hypothetical protein